MIATALRSTSPGMFTDLSEGTAAASVGSAGAYDVRLVAGTESVWLVCSMSGADICALRVGPFAGPIANLAWNASEDGSLVCDFATAIGPVRARISLHDDLLRCRTWLRPTEDVAVTTWPRDLLLLGDLPMEVHTTQRGLRTGALFGSRKRGTPFTLWYVQNFSALNDYYRATQSSPADTVGGNWPEFGYAPPAGEERILPKAREIAVGDALLTLLPRACDTEVVQAETYLDLLAATYVALDTPPVTYHDWPKRAEATLRDLAHSPACSYVHSGRRYLMPYVADDTKPPESMVQFTLAVNTTEYDRWRGAASDLARKLRQSVPSFFDPDVGSIVRWLPHAPFAAGQSEDNMSHAAMDSWYIHHAAFNVFRLARDGDAAAKDLFAKTLPYLVRVAHRFDYRWPVFFDLRTIDVIRGQSGPGKRGETDVGGLYGLVMVHAFEMFGDEAYLCEARTALDRCWGLGFDLAYQLNTTGFAAEAALRLFKITGERSYLDLSTVCMANMFNNVWLWSGEYGHAECYRTFFGLFPLRDAPYIAPYEEVETHAKFHGYIPLGGDELRPSLRLLIAESQRHSLDRCWYYYPDVLPAGAVAQHSQNGHIEHGLAVPLEDLRDGNEQSGQVGQEIYGSGLAFVLVSRHYIKVPSMGAHVYCDYSPYDVVVEDGVVTFRVDGDARRSCEVRVIPPPGDVRLQVRCFAQRAGHGNECEARVSPEGHAMFAAPGGTRLRIVLAQASEPAEGVTIGSLFTSRA